MSLDSKEISYRITKLVKDELIRQKLVNTGNLLNSIEVVFEKTYNGYKFNIVALDYFKYLDEKYKIMENVTNSKEWESIEQLITDYISEEILKNI